MTSNYGVCKDCEAEMPTQDDANAHMSETMSGAVAGSKSHSIRVLNPTPEQKARRVVSWAMERAIDEFCEDIDRDVQRGDVTEEQVTAALAGYPDFADAWAEYMEASA